MPSLANSLSLPSSPIVRPLGASLLGLSPSYLFLAGTSELYALADDILDGNIGDFNSYYQLSSVGVHDRTFIGGWLYFEKASRTLLSLESPNGSYFRIFDDPNGYARVAVNFNPDGSSWGANNSIEATLNLSGWHFVAAIVESNDFNVGSKVNLYVDGVYYNSPNPNLGAPANITDFDLRIQGEAYGVFHGRTNATIPTTDLFKTELDDLYTGSDYYDTIDDLPSSLKALDEWHFVKGFEPNAKLEFRTDTLLTEVGTVSLRPPEAKVSDPIYNVIGSKGGFYQELIDKRPTANADGSISFDGVDDFLNVVAFPASGTFEGTMVCGTSNGTFAFDVSYSAGDLTQIDLLGKVNGFYQAGDLVAFGLFPKLTDAQIDFVRSEFVALGASDGAAVTSLLIYFYDRDDITNFKYFDVDGVANFTFFLAGSQNLQTIDSSSWNTTSATSFTRAFESCSSLTSLDVSNWDVSNVTTFSRFLDSCTSIANLDVSGWNTSSVTNFSNFVNGCSSLTNLDVSSWITSSVTDFSVFAAGCSSLTSLDVSNWNTSSVIDFFGFVSSCSSLASLDVSNWSTSSVTDFGYFVNNCSSLTALDVSNWNTSNVTNFLLFASGCTSLTELTIQGGTGNPFSDSPCTNYTNAFLNTNLNQTSIDNLLIAIEAAGTSNGTFNQSGGSAPSASGEAAIDQLRTRGWTVAVTGGY